MSISTVWRALGELKHRIRAFNAQSLNEGLCSQGCRRYVVVGRAKAQIEVTTLPHDGDQWILHCPSDIIRALKSKRLHIFSLIPAMLLFYHAMPSITPQIIRSYTSTFLRKLLSNDSFHIVTLGKFVLLMSNFSLFTNIYEC
jgi:hypothetical protein